MTEFTTWRSLVDGARIGDIPDSVVLLDDWADGKLTSDRDDFNDTEFSGTESTLVDDGSSGSIQRPEWTVDNGSPSVSDGLLQLSQDESVRTNFDVSSIDNYTWEFKIDDAANFAGLNITANSSSQRGGNRSYTDGYNIRIESDGSINFRVNDGDSISTLIEGTEASYPEVVRIEVDDSGNWEMYQNDESQGTTQDSTFAESDWIGVWAQDDDSDDSIDLDWFVIDDGT